MKRETEHINHEEQEINVPSLTCRSPDDGCVGDELLELVVGGLDVFAGAVAARLGAAQAAILE